MADIFTDSVDQQIDQGYVQPDQSFSDGTVLDLMPELSPVPEPTEIPVLAAPDFVSDEQQEQNSSPDLQPELPDLEAGNQAETVLATDQIDYTELLQKHNEILDSLLLEVRETNARLSGIANAMPVLMCMLGFIIGVLLIQILASYLRV